MRWSERDPDPKGTTKGKKQKYVHTFFVAFEDLKVVWHANETLQFQGKLAENGTAGVNQLLDGKISADIKENDIPAKGGDETNLADVANCEAGFG